MHVSLCESGATKKWKCVSSLLLCMWCVCVLVCGDSNEMFDDRCDLQSRLQQKTSTRHCIMHRSSLHVHCSMCRRSCSMSSVSGSLTTLGHLFINGSRSLSPHFEFQEKNDATMAAEAFGRSFTDTKCFDVPLVALGLFEFSITN